MARHIRGLAEKIWKVFAPKSCALSAARSKDPLVKQCMPIRNPQHSRPCYTDRRSVPRFFTLIEAESYLPEVERLLARCREAKLDFQNADNEIKAFTRQIAFAGGMAVSHARVEGPARRKQESVEALQAVVARFEEIGCLLKDVDTGLMDFPTLYRGNEVYLCWKLGENGITHWHRVEDGFPGRRPIDADFLQNHSS